MSAEQALDLPPDERRARFFLLYSAIFVIGFGNSMLFPLLPPLIRGFGLPDSSVGWIFSLSALAWVLSSPFWGRLSDRAGRKPLAALGLLGYAVSMAVFAAVAQLGQAGVLHGAAVFFGLVTARVIFGLIGSATNPAAQAYIADRTSPSQRTRELAMLSSAFAVGGAVGPASCAMLAAQFGLIAPIALTAVMGLVSGLAILRYLPERRSPLPRKTQERGMADDWRLAMDPHVSPYIVFGVLLSLVTGTLSQIYTLFVMDRLELAGERGAEMAAGGFMVAALAMLVTQMAVLPMLRLGSRSLMLAGAGVLCLSIALQAWAPNYSALLLSQMLCGLGFGLARPGFTGGASMSVGYDKQGAIAGLVVASNGAGFILSPLSGGIAYETWGPLAPLGITFALLVFMLVFVWRSRRLRNTEMAEAAGLDAP